MADLDRDRIVDAALRVADERGAAGCTMRAVADALDVTPMALYRHVNDKAALVALLFDAVVSERPLPPPTGDWHEDAWQMAQWMRTMTGSHPAVSELRRTHQVWTASILPMTERWMNVWQQSGLPLHAAIRAASVTSMTIIGLVEEELLFQRMRRPADTMLSSTPSTRLAFSLKRDVDADFELAVRSLIRGVHAELSPQPALT